MRGFKTMLVSLALAVTFGAFGASWFGQGPKREVVTLVVTGNFKSPRLMAELIQSESRQPYLLLPIPGSDDTRIFFCPSKTLCHQILAKDLNAFVRYLNPQRIVVLGDDKYVQRSYIDLLDRTIPIVRIEGNDWNRIAEQLTDLLNLSRLGDDYKELRETMLNDGRIYRAISRPAPAAPAQNQQGAAVEAEPENAADDVVMEDVAVEEAFEVPLAE